MSTSGLSDPCSQTEFDMRSLTAEAIKARRRLREWLIWQVKG